MGDGKLNFLAINAFSGGNCIVSSSPTASTYYTSHSASALSLENSSGSGGSANIFRLSANDSGYSIYTSIATRREQLLFNQINHHVIYTIRLSTNGKIRTLVGN